jgi:hypothetical protein
MRFPALILSGASLLVLFCFESVWAGPPQRPSKPTDVADIGTQPNASGNPDQVFRDRGANHGSGGMTLLSGGRSRAQALFQQKLDGARVVGTWAGSDRFNDVICWVEYQYGGGQNKSLTVSYQEHRKSGLAWIEYKMEKNSGPQVRRFVFAERFCPAWDGDSQGAAECANDGNAAARPSTPWFVPGSDPADPAQNVPRCGPVWSLTSQGAYEQVPVEATANSGSSGPRPFNDGGGGEM